jgi:hypothetical protein
MTDSRPEPVALFDLDGTLADFPWAMERAMRRLGAPGEKSYYEEQDGEPMHITERRRMIKRVPGFWRSLPKFKLGFDVLEIARRLNFKINILTKAPKSNYPAWSEKAEWCAENLTSFDYQVTMSEDKGIVYGKILVDDWPKYVGRWLEHRPRGLVIMPAHDYNLSFSHPNVVRYDGKNQDEVYDAMSRVRAECSE